MTNLLRRNYICPRAPKPIVIDGRLDDDAWDAAPWSEWFVDIEGDARPAPRFQTRMKMLWDDECLYVAAILHEPHIWGTLTARDSIIFQDNDFEIFIDPDGDTRNYYEFEINALGTIMELTMDKPYHEGGNYALGTHLPGIRTAVYLDGTVNDPRDVDRSWSVEVALPWAGLKQYAGAMACPPNVGDAWRINFSRVQWRHEIVDGKYVKIPKSQSPEDNWVWTPTGLIDMHRPERWGFVRFSVGLPL